MRNILTVFIILLMSGSNVYAQKRIVTQDEMEFIQKMAKKTTNLKELKVEKKGTPDSVDMTVETPIAELAKTTPTNEDKKKKVSNKIYKPAPVVDQANQNGYLIERDSPKIVVKQMSHMDTLNIKMCASAAVTIAFDDSYTGAELQTVVLDDLEYFEAKPFQNNKAVLVKLKNPLQKGSHWESALRLVTKQNDKTFLVNLLGVACPETGGNPFPKVYYIKEKHGLLSKDSKVYTPEDTIIEASEGLPRKNKNVVRVYDMVASSNSAWMIFGVEVQYHNPDSKKTRLLMKVLDNMQTNILPSQLEQLMLPSKKASEFYGVPTLRFNLSVNIDKNYVLNNRYIYLMLLDKETMHYQYKQIDLLKYFISLKKRGFNI